MNEKNFKAIAESCYAMSKQSGIYEINHELVAIANHCNHLLKMNKKHYYITSNGKKIPRVIPKG